MNTQSSKCNKSNNLSASTVADVSTTAATKNSSVGRSAIVNVNETSMTVVVAGDAPSRNPTASSGKSTKVCNPYKKHQSAVSSAAVAPVAASTECGGISTVVEPTIVDINTAQGTLNNAATTSSKLSTIRNPYKKPAAVVPALSTT